MEVDSVQLVLVDMEIVSVQLVLVDIGIESVQLIGVEMEIESVLLVPRAETFVTMRAPMAMGTRNDNHFLQFPSEVVA
jgi:hypothetical protein